MIAIALIAYCLLSLVACLAMGKAMRKLGCEGENLRDEGL